MGLRAVDAYFDGTGLRYVILSKEIVMLEAGDIVRNETKLKAALDKAKSRNAEVIGVVVAKNLLINLLEGGKFDGIVWGSRQHLSGTYTIQ